MSDCANLLFSIDEYQQRIVNVRRRMERDALDVLVISDPCNMYYLTGYEAWSFYVPQYLIVCLSGRPVWLGREMDVRGALLTTWLDNDCIESYADSFVQAENRHPAEVLCSVLADLGVSKGRIGLEYSNYYLTATAYQTIVSLLPNAIVCDASLLVNWVRLVKSDAELDVMREAATLVENAMQVAVSKINPGLRQSVLAGEIYRALIGGTEEFGGQYASSPPFMPSGERYATPHLSWTDRCYADNTSTNFELVASRHRYHVPLSRSVFIGKPPMRLQALESAALEGLDAALSIIRPGVLAADIEAAWQNGASRYKVQKNARCGYPIGIAYPPTFGEQTVSLRPEDMTVLKKGMAFHLMTGVWQELRSIVITEPFVVTDNGVELLCSFPRKLFVVE